MIDFVRRQLIWRGRPAPVRDRRQPCHLGARRGQTGFSLLELLVVLGILALLATVAAPRLVKYFGKAKSDTALVQVASLSSAIELYYLDVGEYPTQHQGISALITKPAGVENWNGPYLKKANDLKDPWGRPYIYVYPGTHGEFDVSSLGRDGTPGGEGENRDLTNW